MRRRKADFSELFSDFQLYEQKRRQQGRGEDEEKVFQPFQPEIFPREQRENPEYRSHAGEPDEETEKLPFETLFYFEAHKFVFERDRGGRGAHAGGKLRELFVWLEEKQDEGKDGEGRGENGFLLGEFPINDLPDTRKGDAQRRARQHVGGIMHAEIQAGEHDEQREDGRDNPRPTLFQTEGGGKKQPRAHLRMSAGKGHVGLEVHRRKKGRVDLHARRRAARVGAGAGNDALEKGVCAHRGEGDENETFAELLIDQPIDDGNERHENQRFAEQGKGAREKGEGGRA